MNSLITNDYLYKLADNIFNIKLIDTCLTKKSVNLIYCPNNFYTIVKNDAFLKNVLKTNIPLIEKNPFNLPHEITNIISLFSNNFISWLKFGY